MRAREAVPRARPCRSNLFNGYFDRGGRLPAAAKLLDPQDRRCLRATVLDDGPPHVVGRFLSADPFLVKPAGRLGLAESPVRHRAVEHLLQVGRIEAYARREVQIVHGRPKVPGPVLSGAECSDVVATRIKVSDRFSGETY